MSITLIGNLVRLFCIQRDRKVNRELRFDL